MTAIREWLQGKKTYVVAIGAIVAALVAWSQGTMDTMQLVEAGVAAVLAMTIRAGVTTETK